MVKPSPGQAASPASNRSGNPAAVPLGASRKQEQVLPAAAQEAAVPLPAWLVALFATACGLTAANLYYAQPLIQVISSSLGLASTAASLIVTLTQLGYCAGLIFLVPLGDLLENRRLVVCTLGALVLALMLAAAAPTAGLFLLAMALLGVSAVAAQMLVPIAAHMAPEAGRGQVVGTIMSGLLLGILLARPAALLIANALGWRAVFVASALLIGMMAVALSQRLPQRHPALVQSYAELTGSLWPLWRSNPVLRRRAIYQMGLFAAFTLFWTAVPLELASPSFGLSPYGIALFSLAGALGAVAAPVAGRLADRGWSRSVTGMALGMVVLAFLLAGLGARGSLPELVAASVLLDIGVQASLVVGQRAIYSLRADQRSRLNGLYIALFFAGGALGSALASPLFARGGWALVSGAGLVFPMMALAVYLGEWRLR